MDTPTADGIAEVLLGNTRAAVLALLLGKPGEEFHVRQAARLSHAPLAPVQRELKLLARLGILTSRTIGNHLLYTANLGCPVRQELGGLVLKTSGLVDLLKEALRPLTKQIGIAFIFGSMTRGEQRSHSDVDVFIIGEVTLASVVAAFAGAQQRLGREINPRIYSAVEVGKKLQARHHFLTSVMAAPKFFLIGDADELARMAHQWVATPASDQSGGGRRPVGSHKARSDGKRERICGR